MQVLKPTALPQTNIDASDYAEIIADLETEITERRWEIGTVAIDAVEDGTSIAELARQTRIPRSTLDSYYQNTKFYPEGDRDYLMQYEGFTWSILSNVRKFISGDHNTQWSKDIYGALSFFNHCAAAGSVTADQVRREIQIAKGKPKPRKKVIAAGIPIEVDYNPIQMAFEVRFRDGFPPEVGAGYFTIDICEVTS